MRADRVHGLFFGIFLLAAGIFFPSPAITENASAESVSVSARVIDSFRIGSREKDFGALEFVGGLEMISRSRDFGGISSFRFRSPGESFIGVTDTGFWFFGKILRDESGRPSAIEDFTMSPILDAAGNAGEKWTTDAEAIALRGNRVVVGFEREHRISEFRLEPGKMGSPVADLDFLIPRHELRMNRSFETVAFAPQESVLAGALVAITERSIDKNGNVFAAVLDAPRKGVFTIARRDEFDITDGAFLPDGDLLLLERSFSLSAGVAMRLRRIPAETIRPGGIADGPVLLEADMGYQIDNMEALDVWQRSDGATMISLMSDDNRSFLQRNLYLEFRLLER